MTDIERVIAEFVANVEQRFDLNNLDSFWDCEAIFRSLLDGDFAQNVVNAQLRHLASDPHYMGDWPESQIILYRGPGYALSLALLRSSRTYIHTTSFLAMYAPVSGSALSYDRYRFPSTYENAAFDPVISLEKDDSGRVEARELLKLYSHSYAYDFKIEQPLLVLKFTTAAFHVLEWLFHKDSLRPWQANDSTLVSTRLRVAAHLLGRLAHPSSVEALEFLASHPNPTVRWAGIQNLARVSPSEATIRLNRAVDDPHPHVRRAAVKSLMQRQKKAVE